MIKIIAEPSGEYSLGKALGWLDDFEKKSDDLSPLFKEMEPDIIKSVKYEFSGTNSSGNPNKWKLLSRNYLAEKKAAGFPENIGIRTEQLLENSTKNARKIYLPNTLQWHIEPTYDGDERYDDRFTSIRPIGIYTIDFIKRVLNSSIMRYIRRAKR